jgi:tRNA1Val (adenine37-N6)-methyltransferase
VGIVRAARRPPGWIAPGPAPAGARGRPELEPAADEDLCFLTGDWRLFQKRRGHRWSLDDLVTGWVAARSAASPARVLDLGCGAGSVLLMLAWKLPAADLTGIEAQPDRAAMGRRSIAYNGVEDRCRIVDGDLRALSLDGTFDLVTGTPPYFPRGTGTESDQPHAAPCRFELRGGVEDYLTAAARVLAPTGTFTMCSAALERDRVERAAATSGLAITEHWTVIPRAGKDPLICVDVLRHTGDRIDHTLTVRDTAGQWTAAFRGVRNDMGMPVTSLPKSQSRR